MFVLLSQELQKSQSQIDMHVDANAGNFSEHILEYRVWIAPCYLNLY